MSLYSRVACGLFSVILLSSTLAAQAAPPILRVSGPAFISPANHRMVGPQQVAIDRRPQLSVTGNSSTPSRSYRVYAQHSLQPWMNYAQPRFQSPLRESRFAPIIYRDRLASSPAESTDTAPKQKPLVITPKVQESPLVKVLEVIDGTHLVVRRGEDQVRIRLLGIRTAGEPGEQAKALLSDIFQDDYAVLQYDETAAKVDAEGYAVAIVHSSRMHESINIALVRKGLAVTDDRYEFADKAMYQAVQAQAKASGRGAWSSN